MQKIILLLFNIYILSGVMMPQKQNIALSAEDVCPIKIGEKVPNTMIKDVQGKEFNISEIINNKKSIIIFYRGGWCPYCNLHLSDLQAIEEDLIKYGYKIIAISVDIPKYLAATIEKHNLKYELFSDSEANATKAFGIAFRVDNEYINKLKSFNMDIEASSGNRNHILPVPSVFIVDANGIIKFEYVNPNYKERISGKLLLEAAILFR